MNKLKIALSVLLLVAVAAACSVSDNKRQDEGKKDDAAEETEYANDSNLFDGTKAKPGDKVANMTIVSTNAAVAETMPEYGPIGTVEFKGEAKVSGTFEFHKDHEFLGDAVAFTVDEQSASKLPKLQNDERNVWFVIENVEEAGRMLGREEGKGKAEIIIDHYVIRYEPKEVYNTAKLVKVVEVKSEAAK